MEVCNLLCWSLVLLILYTLLDRLIRIPYIGRYDERYILVTGCDTGFGHELVKRLDRLGCHVFAGCLTEKGETELNKICSNRVQTIPLDVTRHESVLKAYELVESKLPEGKGLWGVMNNAGKVGPVGRVEWMSIPDIKSLLDVNLFGVVDVTTTFLPLVKKARGRIVNTSSILGRSSVEFTIPYNISKYGVEAFTDGIRRSLRIFGCRAVLVEPGAYRTVLTSPENVRRSIDSVWDQAPPEVKEEFGEEFHESYAASFSLSFWTTGSDNVGEVADAYVHALLARFPRARYLVGKDANTLWRGIEKLPEWLSDLMLEQIFATRKMIPAYLSRKTK